LTEVYDALVIGGGPAGSTTALLLARAGWSVVLVERQEFPRPKVCGEYLSATNLPLLDRLGVGSEFRQLAGPPVRRVGLFSGQHQLEAELPRYRTSEHEWGRALSRLRLDSLLLNQAHRAGTEIRQPWKVRSISRRGGVFHCGIVAPSSGASETVAAHIVVGAHGSWHPGTLATQPPRRPAVGADLLGFKCHFEGSTLAVGLMPLLAFPGGYGGMVRCEDNLVSLSCCVRRDRLSALRREHGGDAGVALLDHVQANCAGVREALAGARPAGAWLAAGPIRPGMRAKKRHGVLLVGNAAGEAHPAIAEGISIALQSAWLLSDKLIAWRRQGAKAEQLRALAGNYAADWQRHFAYRM
jgi:flavin-dependent dehydrogenase